MRLYTDKGLFTKKKIIFIDGDGKKQNKTFYIDIYGRAWDNEHLARYSSCDANVCKICGAVLENKTETLCSMHYKQDAETKDAALFAALPGKAWDHQTPLVIYNTDTYFFDESDLNDYCDEHNVQPAELKLCICEPQYAKEIDFDEIYEDVLPEEDLIENCSHELQEQCDLFNKFLREHKIILSWVQDDIRAVL